MTPVTCLTPFTPVAFCVGRTNTFPTFRVTVSSGVFACACWEILKKSVSYGCQDSAIRRHTDIQRIYLCSRCRGNHNTHDYICHTCLRPHPRHTDTVRPRHMSWKLILTGCSYRPSSLHFFANQRNRAEGKRKRKKIKHASMLKCMCVYVCVCLTRQVSQARPVTFSRHEHFPVVRSQWLESAPLTSHPHSEKEIIIVG